MSKSVEELIVEIHGIRNSVVASRRHSWRRGKQSASLDNTVTWNYPLSQPQVCPFEAKQEEMLFIGIQMEDQV